MLTAKNGARLLTAPKKKKRKALAYAKRENGSLIRIQTFSLAVLCTYRRAQTPPPSSVNGYGGTNVFPDLDD